MCGVLMVLWRAPERVVSRVFCSSYFCWFFSRIFPLDSVENVRLAVTILEAAVIYCV